MSRWFLVASTASVATFSSTARSTGEELTKLSIRVSPHSQRDEWIDRRYQDWLRSLELVRFLTKLRYLQDQGAHEHTLDDSVSSIVEH